MTRLQQTRRLARAFKRMEQVEDKLAEERRALDAEFRNWAAGRRIDRDVARRHLVSTGYLDERMERR